MQTGVEVGAEQEDWSKSLGEAQLGLGVLSAQSGDFLSPPQQTRGLFSQEGDTEVGTERDRDTASRELKPRGRKYKFTELYPFSPFQLPDPPQPP